MGFCCVCINRFLGLRAGRGTAEDLSLFRFWGPHHMDFVFGGPYWDPAIRGNYHINTAAALCEFLSGTCTFRQVVPGSQS